LVFSAYRILSTKKPSIANFNNKADNIINSSPTPLIFLSTQEVSSFEKHLNSPALQRFGYHPAT